MSSASYVDYAVIGAGMSGLGFANFIRSQTVAKGRPLPSVAVFEKQDEPGGYCKTVKQDGFVWDYSGHFFHFRVPEIEQWLRQRMPGQDIRTVAKKSSIRYRGFDIDFPFQKNIHQLPKEDFIDCLVSLYFRDSYQGDRSSNSFYDMVMSRYGRGIAERFLIPYNEKLYACDLNTLDAGAMGRFFPAADIPDILRNMQNSDNASYNATFTYPAGGAYEYVKALLLDLPAETVRLNQPVLAIDLASKTLTTASGQTRFGSLVSSAPLPQLLRLCDLKFDSATFTSNKVQVFNLGFDRKGPRHVHWIYFPDKTLSFYRVGFYDNIFESDRMSLYVEIGCSSEQVVDEKALLQTVLVDLRREGIVRDHELVSSHSVMLDPAYVHISSASVAAHRQWDQELRRQGVYSVGRYGGWTYCSIEDNLLEVKALAASLVP